jgi:hypothetical protein
MSSRSEADALAERIRAYWASRGRNPAVRVEWVLCTASATDNRGEWCVRSNMVGGWPSKAGPAPTSPPNSQADSKSRVSSPVIELAAVLQPGNEVESVAPPLAFWRQHDFLPVSTIHGGAHGQ